jgi:hypothetical protein
MGAASLSLTAVVQDVFQLTETAQQQAPANATPVNANQAQGAPAPPDTVTLTNQAAEGQQAGQDPNRGRFDRAAFLGAAGLFIGENNPGQDYRTQQPTLPVPLPQLQTQDAPAAPASNAASAAANAAANAATTAAQAAAPAPADPAATGNFTTPQQELQQLDHTLQQLGISPQSIPLFNRMAMLLYANDPAALRLLVQTLQTAAAQQGAAQPPANAANANQPLAQALLPSTAPANQGQTAAQAPAGAQPQDQPAPQVEVLAAQISFTDVQATLPAPAAQGAPNQPAANAAPNAPAPQSHPFTVQIEELQIAFQAVDIQSVQQQPSGSASSSNSTGNALNVTA